MSPSAPTSHCMSSVWTKRIRRFKGYGVSLRKQAWWGFQTGGTIQRAGMTFLILFAISLLHLFIRASEFAVRWELRIIYIIIL